MKDERKPRAYGRGAFLVVVAGGVSSLAWGSRAWHAVSGPLGPVAGVLGASSGWRIYTVGDRMPSFDPATWRLRIDGLVERPVELTYRDLRALPRVHETADFHCVTGWTVKRVRWAGVRFDALLRLARPRAKAGALRFVSAEKPYEDYLTLEQVALPRALLAYELDGRPLPRAHGAPVRVVLPEMYGYKGVKWVERIEVVAAERDGYWEQRGYDRDAWVGRSNSGFRRPQPAAPCRGCPPVPL